MVVVVPPEVVVVPPDVVVESDVVVVDLGECGFVGFCEAVVVVVVELSVVVEGSVEVVEVPELVELSPSSPPAMTITAISRPTITAIRPAISQRELPSPPGSRRGGTTRSASARST